MRKESETWFWIKSYDRESYESKRDLQVTDVKQPLTTDGESLTSELCCDRSIWTTKSCPQLKDKELASCMNGEMKVYLPVLGWEAG